MKRLFSLIALMLVSECSFARDIILVENEASLSEGQMLLQIMEKKFNVPKTLVTYQPIKTCSRPTDAIMHLCLKADGNLEILKVNRFVMKNSFGAFFE